MAHGSRLAFTVVGISFAGILQAQVTLDGTLGPAGPLAGPHYAITAELGQQRGGNLFHSFGRFSIHRGESATFSGPNSVNNIIGRVTGGQVSTIDGALRSTISGANLYLLNPAGVLFGENASLDVPGSVHVSTADYLRLGDGGRFDARTPGNSVLTVAPVEAFGFLSDAPGRIEINGSFLGVPEGQTLSLIGGDITLTDATVYAPAGRINVAVVGSAGEVVPTDNDLGMQGFGRLGTLTIERDPDVERVTVDMGEPFGEVSLGDLDASGEGGGAIFIRGGQWVSQGGWVYADTYGAQAGQGVDVAIADTLTLLNGGTIGADTFGPGDAGSVIIRAGNLLVDGQGGLFTSIASAAQSGSSGAGGDVNLTVEDTLTLLNGGAIRTSTYAQGDAGSVTLTARNLLVDRLGSRLFTGIDSDTYYRTGAGGDVNLTVADTLTLLNGGAIGADTFGPGDAGSVTIHAGNLLVDGRDFTGFTGITSDTRSPGTSPSAGAGGDVNLTVEGTLTLLNGGAISVYTRSAGDAGSVTVRTGNLLVDRQGSTQFTGIISDADPGSTGAGGDVNLTVADTVTLLNGGVIRASTFAQGDAGSVTLTAGNLLVDGQGGFTGITSDAYSGSTGAGGAVDLTVEDTLTVRNGGEIRASTWGKGNAGSVTVRAGNLLVDTQGNKLAVIASSPQDGSTGDGGNVNVTVADTLSILNGGAIFTGTLGSGNSGNITITTRNLLVDGQGSESFTGINSGVGSDSTGDGGDVNLTVADTLTLLDGGQILTSTFGEGNAGSVTIKAGNLLVDGQGQLTSIESSVYSFGNAGGNGGNINLTVADTLTLRNGGQIKSRINNDDGNGGNITITARNFLIDGQGLGDRNGWGITGIFSDTGNGSDGNPGNVNLTVADTLTLLHSGVITTDTMGAGDAGSITINTGNLIVDGVGYSPLTVISSIVNFNTSPGGATGNGGKINITVADTLTLLRGGQIIALTFGRGHAGDITITARNLLVDGEGARLFNGIATDTDGVYNGKYGDSGNGGNINLTVADTLTVKNSGEIFASSIRGSTGHAGSVTINAGNVLVDGPGYYQGYPHPTAITSYTETIGDGGEVNLTVADTLTISNGGQISASTRGAGNAGSVTIHAGNLLVDGQGSEDFTGIANGAEPDSTGSGGDVKLTVADTLTLLNGGEISIDSSGAGQAGHLTLTTPSLTLSDSSSISAQSLNTTGGNLLINADHLKLLNGSEISTSVFGDLTTQGGDVTLNSTNIVALNGSTVTARATEGFGGNIRVNAQVFLHDAPSTDDVLNVSSETFGNDGSVELNAPTTDLSGSLVAAEPHYLDATAQLSQRCGGEEMGERSRFLVQGRGALPPAPGDPATAPLGRCVPGALALAAAAATDAPPPAARAPRVAEFGFNNR